MHPTTTTVRLPLTETLSPEPFYALGGDRRRQAAALALLDGAGLLAFAAACGELLERRYGIAVPALAVLAVWRTVGLLAD